MKDRKIILNRIRTPDGTILTSYYRHDFKQYWDKISHELYMVDGGNNYLKRNVNIYEYEELSIYSDSPFYIIRENLYWGTYGETGKDKLKFIPLCDMSNSHIENILNKVENFSEMYKDYFWEELLYRKENNIIIKEK